MKKRNWIRFSLRTLLVAMTVVALWIGFKANRANQQKLAVQRILALGGSVTYQHEVDANGQQIKNPVLAGPTWLRRLIGSEYFDRVQEINLWESKVTDDDLRLVRGARDAQKLLLRRTSITDQGLQQVADLSYLEHLELSETKISDAGLDSLLSLKRLKYIELDGTQLTDQCASTLVQLPSLEAVSVIGTQMGDSGVQQLIDSGLAVFCMLDCKVAAFDESRNPRQVLYAGQQIPIEGTFRIPQGAQLKPGHFIVSIIGNQSTEHPRVIQQQGIAQLQGSSNDTHTFSIVLDLKSPETRQIPGSLHVNFSGIDIVETPLTALKPESDSPGVED